MVACCSRATPRTRCRRSWARQTTEYLDLAKRLNLLVTGGSDFHGITKPDIEVGTGRGDLKVPERLLDPLKEAALFVGHS